MQSKKNTEIELPDDQTKMDDLEEQPLSDNSFSDEEITDDDVLKEIEEKTKLWFERDRVNIEAARDDKYFTFINNFTTEQIAGLDKIGRRPVQFNIVYDTVNKILGEQRRSTPSLQVVSLNGASTDKEIKVQADVVRGISFSSKANIAYQTTYGEQITGGFGVLMCHPKPVSPDSFDQYPCISSTTTPERFIFDIDAMEQTKADGAFCGYFLNVSEAKFERMYPGVPIPTSFPFFSSPSGFTWGSVNEKTVTIISWFRKVSYKFKLLKLSNGEIIREEAYKKKYQSGESLELPGFMIPQIVSSTESRDVKIKEYRAIYGKMLGKQDFPSRELPYVRVPGQMVNINGMERTISFVRHVKDAQSVHNRMITETMYNVEISRRELFFGPEECVAGLEDVYKNPGNVQGYLPYKALPNGERPQRLPPVEVPQSLIGLLQQSQASVQTILGFYEANLGQNTVEKSGIAIENQQSAGNLSLSTYKDNLLRGIEQIGRVVMSMKTFLYDTERKVPTIDEAGKSGFAEINQRVAGSMVINDMTNHNFDIVIEAGSSDAIERRRSLDTLMELCSIIPQAAMMTADYIGENLSLNNLPGIVKRLRTLVPPELLDIDNGGDGRKPPPPPPQPDPMMIEQLKLKNRELDIKENEQHIEVMKLENDQKNQQLEMYKIEAQMKQVSDKSMAELVKAETDHNSTILESATKLITHNNKI